MVCIDVIKSPLREREGAASSPAGHVPSDSEGRVRADAKRGRGWGTGRWFRTWFCFGYFAPSGSGRGQRAVRPGTSRATARVVSGQTRSGGGGGARDVGFARGFVLVILPPPGAGGGSERLTGHDPSEARGCVRAGAKRGKGWGLGSAPWRHSTIMINRYLIGRHEGHSEAKRAESPHDARKLESLFIHNSINGETSASRATRTGGKGGPGPHPPGRGARQVFCFILRILFVFKPPAGGAGGNELSDRARPERKRGS